MIKTKSSLKTYAYANIKQKILTCQFVPGEAINEQIIMEDLDISRTPIREALNRLEQEGLIKILPKVGVIVSEISYGDVKKVFEVREWLEPQCVRQYGSLLSKEKLQYYHDELQRSQQDDTTEDYTLDTEMHRFFFSVCNNHYLIDLLNTVLDQNNRVVIIARGNGARMHDSKLEHDGILKALLADDLELATNLLIAHLQNCKKSTLEYYTKYYLK